MDTDAAPRPRGDDLGADGGASPSRRTTRRGSGPARGRPGSRRRPHDGEPGARTRARHRPRLRRADEAADHRAAARHDRAGHGPRHARGARHPDRPTGASSVFWTMVCGTLAAGSANAINCYLDRDIDELMTRTRRRPLPAHQVEPERAVVFGLVLGVVSVALMAWFVNLTAAFLTLLAIAFYVIVYTIWLKRSTPQNIVIGGAAGALPPVIGWAAVTGSVGHPGPPAVRARLLLDAAALLGAVAADPQGLRRGRRADAAGGEGHPRDDPPDRPVHDPDGRDLARALGGRPDGRDLPGRGRRPRRDLPVAGLPAVAARRVGGGLDRRRDRALQVLDQLPVAALPRGRRRRAGADPAAACPAAATGGQRQPRSGAT